MDKRLFMGLCAFMLFLSASKHSLGELSGFDYPCCPDQFDDEGNAVVDVACRTSVDAIYATCPKGPYPDCKKGEKYFDGAACSCQPCEDTMAQGGGPGCSGGESCCNGVCCEPGMCIYTGAGGGFTFQCAGGSGRVCE